MDNEKFQERLLEVLESLKLESTEIRQTTNQLYQRIDNIESAILRMENNLDQRLQALLKAQQAQIEISQRICDALNQNGEKEETSSKGLFS
jgi:hypothetical protein